VSDPVQPDELQDGALCTLNDVILRVPGYDPGDEADTDAALNDFIVTESADFIETTGREILPKNADAFRIFELTATRVRRRSLPIGDVADVTQLELLDYDESTVLDTIDPSLYVLRPRDRAAWEPFRRLTFPYRPGSSLLLAPGRTLKLTGTFGFPAIPATVRRSIATFVVVRYLNDSASAGTKFAELANQEDVDLGPAIRVALETRRRLTLPGMA
jgi:hypothetical protein